MPSAFSLRLFPRVILKLAAVVVFIGICFTHVLAQGAGKTPAVHFQIQRPPFNSVTGMEVIAISALSDTDVWGVGHSSVHWDGTTWTLIPIVQAGGGTLVLSGVSALSSTDVWAVGPFVTSGGGTQETVEHFDGASWKVFPDVNLIGKNFDGVVDNEALTSISALSANDIWAAGYVSIQPPCDCIVPFIEHFDGAKWSLSGLLLTVNSPGNFQFLEGISAISDTDVWAVGYTSLLGALNGAAQAFHFDGKQWSQVAAPSGQAARFNAVTAIASDDVWAVGYAQNEQQTFIEHFDGTQWQVVTSPSTSDPTNILLGVGAVSSTSVWAVGQHFKAQGAPLVEHFDGTLWSIVPAPGESGSFGTTLFGVSGLASGHLWLGGDFLSPKLPPERPFVLFSSQGAVGMNHTTRE